ncbi:IS21-like element helper ATPase IstB [Crocinitomix catalasitica]|nr:IS21-like element helper ATPase IstB [Crocinitomix catalasitica]
MNEQTLEKMNRLRFFGMHRAFKTALESGRTDDLTLDEFITYLVDAEDDDRSDRKINRLIKMARFRYKASMEKLIYDGARRLDKNYIMRLAEFSFIDKGENLIITGLTGVGKSYLACALGQQACIEGYKVRYFNTAKLFGSLKMAKADASYIREMAKLERQDLLILDDFGLQPLDSQSRLMLLDLVEDRHQKGSLIFTSQIPVDKWYELIGEKTVADAILDRVVHNAHRINLKGESLRKKSRLTMKENVN